MTFLLDTNVASEGIKKSPDPKVTAWLAAVPDASKHLSTITLAEIRYGIEARADGSKRRTLEAWYPALVAAFSGRVLPVDAAVAEVWGIVRRRAESRRRTMPMMDIFLAATAEVHGLTLVTRNLADFAGWAGPVLNPWDA